MNIELRDYFAAKAMGGILADPNVNGSYHDTFAEFCDEVAKEAYEVADAMLAAREVGQVEKKADDGWIEWQGGECPVDDNIFVEAKTMGYGTQARRKAGLFRWDRRLNAGDIIAYRVVQP